MKEKTGYCEYCFQWIPISGDTLTTHNKPVVCVYEDCRGGTFTVHTYCDGSGRLPGEPNRKYWTK